MLFAAVHDVLDPRLQRVGVRTREAVLRQGDHEVFAAEVDVRDGGDEELYGGKSSVSDSLLVEECMCSYHK